METKRLLISSVNATEAEELLKVDGFLRDECTFAAKDQRRVRLLIEETLGMLRQMAGAYSAMLWLESHPEVPGDNNVRLHVVATSRMDINKKKELLSLAGSGKNAYAKGFMSKLGDMIENGILNYENAMALQQKYGLGYVEVAATGGNPSDVMFSWTLDQYRRSLQQEMQQNDKAAEAWDELEKSIVASIAKNVIVGVRKDHVELLIDTELTGN